MAERESRVEAGRLHLRCSCCLAWKAVDDFYLERARPRRFERQAYCKGCSVEAVRRMREKDRSRGGSAPRSLGLADLLLSIG